MGCDHQSPEQSLEGVVDLKFPLNATDFVQYSPRENGKKRKKTKIKYEQELDLTSLLRLQLFSQSVEGFLSMHQVFVSLMSIVRGRLGLQRLCRVHPVLGPLYGLLLTGAGVWLLAKLFGAVLIRAYRYCPTFVIVFPS